MRQFIDEEGSVSSSFLETVSAGNYKIEDLDIWGVFEFLIFGSIQDSNTLIKKIHKKTTHQPSYLDPEMGFFDIMTNEDNFLNENSLLGINEAKNHYLNFFKNRRDQLLGRKISIDLTGGIDSRLIAATLLHFNIPFDAVYSLISGNDQEQEIVEHVVNELQVPLKIISKPHEIKSRTEIQELIKLGDGLWDPLGLQSLKRTQSWRQSEGYDLAITGIAGELYKDFWWQQDFPIYRKKKPNLKRLLQMRMYPVTLPESWIGKFWRTEYSNFIPRFISNMKLYRKKWNTKTYDQIYYHLRIKEQVSVLSHVSSYYLPVYSPLLEPELLKIGYNLKRRDRFFNRFHRAVISECAPQLARLPTTDGNMTVSDENGKIGRDLFRFVHHKSSRLFAKLSGKATETEKKKKQNAFILLEASKAIEKLKEAGLLSDEAPNQSVNFPEKLHGRLITMSNLLDQLD